MKIIGLDTGTNSLGWAIVEKQDNSYQLLEHGTHIFQEGVVNTDNSSPASERTAHRALRRRFYRIKLRKIRLLSILIKEGLCPPLTKEELSLWRLKKVYPTNKEFLRWEYSIGEDNPYTYRHKCLHEELDLTQQSDRYILGRALYHLSQRRGFLSNRKEDDSIDTRIKKEKTDNQPLTSGEIKQQIVQLDTIMRREGMEYLGDYFYTLYQRGEKIRCHYTSRKEHYEKELLAICGRQGLSDELTQQLEKVIISQRPLKSQKQTIGRCVFEKDKTRCLITHPSFEEFRMLCFINNIRIFAPGDSDMRPLNDHERAQIIPLFYRKSKPNFNFSDIADTIVSKKNYEYHKEGCPFEVPFNKQDLFGQSTNYYFNFQSDTSVTGCPVTTSLRTLFGGENWKHNLYQRYTKASSKTIEQVVNDVWNVLSFYNDDSKLAQWGRDYLALTEEEAKTFSAIKMPSEYTKLSLCAINKILPYLR